MKLTIYQVDAFTNKLFGGNPAAVIPLEKWLDDELMQKLALENNLSETVFFVKNGKDYDIRWFTPAIEINLCGHATLASAFILYNYLDYKNPELVFHSKSGKLQIGQRGDLFVMDFPSWKPKPSDHYPANLKEIIGVNEIVSVYKHRDLLVELRTEEDVRNADPNFAAIKKLGEKIIITAPGNPSGRSKRPDGFIDFVSRFFAPSVGVDEDPVTGSAHSQLIPFWSEKLAKKKMHALQLSKRGGELWVNDLGERVTMAGECVFYMRGEIEIDN
jgi:PhzF family phenazine biosynthesis protein